MEALLVLGGVVLLSLLFGKKKTETPPEDLKTYAEKAIDELARTETVTTWKDTDTMINGFTDQFSECGELAATSEPASGELIKAVVDLFCKIFKSGNNHYMAVDGKLIDKLGNVLALGHAGKPLNAAVCCQMVLAQGVYADVVNGFIDWTKKRDVTFKIYNVSGSVPGSGNLSAGKYFIFGKIMTTGEPELVPAFLKSAIANGEAAATYWRANSAAIVSPPVIIITKESIMARIDP